MWHLSSYFRSNAVLWFRGGARWFAGISFILLTALLAGAAHAEGSAERDALRPIEKALETLQVTNYQIRQNEDSALLLLRRPSRSFGGPDADGLLIVVRPFKWEGQSQQWYQLEAPNLYSLRQCEHPNAARRVLLEAPYKTQTDVQFYCNPNAGSVSARVAMPASDGTVSSALLAEYLDQIVRSVDTIDPVVQRAMVSGLIDWPMDDEGPKEPKGFLSVPGPDGKLVKIGWAPWFEQSILASSAISSDPIWRKFTEQNDEERERVGHWLALEAIDGTNESTYQAWMTSSNYVEQHYPPFSIRFWGPPGTKVSASVRIDGFAVQTNGSAEIDAMGVKEVDLLHGVFAQTGFPVRGSLSLWGESLEAFTAAGIAAGAGDDRLRSQTIKWVSDGSNQGYTGYMRENYVGRDTRGVANFTPEQLAANFAKTVAAQWPIMCHANGDAALDMVMAAFAATAKLPGWDAGKRHRIEHCSLLHDEHIAAMASLGVSPSFLMNHVRLWGRVMRDEILGPERADLLDRYASVTKAGIRDSFHCDFSVSPIGPLNYIATAAARTMADGGEVLNAAERVSVEQALRASTIDAAWMCHADGLVGSLEAGKAADFVLLGDDPLAHEKDPDAVRDIAVLATYSDGAEVHSA